MESRAQLRDFGIDPVDNRLLLTFVVSDNTSCEAVQSLVGKDLDLDAKVHREKRSLNANAYFHKLVGLLSEKLTISQSKMKNILVSQYGQVELIDSEPMIYKTNAPEEWMQEREEIHTKLVKITEENGKPVYFYRVYRGTHTYDSKEMSMLINGTVQEAKEQGIETLTPTELERMCSEWKA